MFSLKPCKSRCNSPFLSNPRRLQNLAKPQSTLFAPCRVLSPHERRLGVRASSGKGEAEKKERRPFLTLEEAGLVEISGLSTHERFLCRLTVLFSSVTFSTLLLYVPQRFSRFSLSHSHIKFNVLKSSCSNLVDDKFNCASRYRR